jgi:hypothetical protein
VGSPVLFKRSLCKKCRRLVCWSTLKVESIASFHVWRRWRTRSGPQNSSGMENEVGTPHLFRDVPHTFHYFPRLILFYYTHKSPTHGGCCFRFYVSLLPVGSFWIFQVTFVDPLMPSWQWNIFHWCRWFCVSKKMVSFIARFVLREGIVYVDMPVNWGNQPCQKPPWLWLGSSTSGTPQISHHLTNRRTILKP